MKEVFTSLDEHFRVASSGRDQTKRVVVNQKAHAGPKDTIGRAVVLVMDPAESLALAVSLLGMLTPEEVASQPDKVIKIKAVMRMVEVATNTLTKPKL